MISVKFVRFAFVLALIAISMSACSQDNGTPLAPIDNTGILKGLLDRKITRFTDGDIYYGESKSKIAVKKNNGALTRREIFTIFPNRYLYDAPDGKLRFFDMDKAEPDVRSSLLEDTSTESYGYILGKIEIHNSPWTIFVIIEGEDYYPRSVVLYPVNTSGKVLPGLEVSNWWADDLDELTVRSQVKAAKGLSVITTVTQAIYKDMPPEQQQREVIESRKTSVMRWNFYPDKGFVREP